MAFGEPLNYGSLERKLSEWNIVRVFVILLFRGRLNCLNCGRRLFAAGLKPEWQCGFSRRQ